MSTKFNSNGDDFKGFDEYFGSIAMNGIKKAASKATGNVITTQQLGILAKNMGSSDVDIGTVIRYGLGGGMDTTTFSDGSQAHFFSDGDGVMVDEHGKYIGSLRLD